MPAAFSYAHSDFRQFFFISSNYGTPFTLKAIAKYVLHAEGIDRHKDINFSAVRAHALSQTVTVRQPKSYFASNSYSGICHNMLTETWPERS